MIPKLSKEKQKYLKFSKYNLEYLNYSQHFILFYAFQYFKNLLHNNDISTLLVQYYSNFNFHLKYLILIIIHRAKEFILIMILIKNR